MGLTVSTEARETCGSRGKSSIHQSCSCCRQCLLRSGLLAKLRSASSSCTEGRYNCVLVRRGAEAGTQPSPGRRDLVVTRACAGMHAEMLSVACCADLHDKHQLRWRGLRRALHAGLVWAQRMPPCRPPKNLSRKVTISPLCCKEPPDKCSTATPLRGMIPQLAQSATCSQPLIQVCATPLHPSCMVLQVRWKASHRDPLWVQRGSKGPLSAQSGSTDSAGACRRCSGAMGAAPGCSAQSFCSNGGLAGGR